MVPPADSEALTEAILYLLQNKELAKNIGLAGKDRVKTHFSFQKMMSEIEGLYESLLEGKVLKKENTMVELKNFAKAKINKLVKVSISSLLYYSGIIYLIRKLSKNNGITILAYHKINNDTPNYLGLNTSISSFEAQMKYLRQNYNLISLEKATQLIQDGERILDNAVVVTFDDGYKDTYINAFPIIKKYDIPVTIFLTAGLINSKNTLWYEQIIAIINETTQKILDLSSFGLKKFIIDTPAAKKNAVSEIVNYAKGLNKSEQEKLIKFMSDKLEVNVDEVRSYSQMLSWEEINEMKNNGISFGSHGLTHSILSRLTLKEAEYEISESKKILENKLNMQIDTFAYPNGTAEDFNKEIINILKNNGFSSACTLIRGSNNTDLFALKRKCINDGLAKGIFGNFSKCLFATEMTGVFDLIKRKKVKAKNQIRFRISDFPTLSPNLLFNSNGKVDLSSLYHGANTTLFYFGRGAIWNAVKMMELAPEDNILMPAYHCSIEVEAVYKAGANIKFYKVRKDMSSDLNDIEEKIDKNTKAIFIIHYFGFPQPIEEITKICRKYNLFLIEDAAHAFLSSYKGRYLGTFGDYGILSMKKTLPIPDGGALIINNSHNYVESNLKDINKFSLLRMVIIMLAKRLETKCSYSYMILDSLFLKPVKIILSLLKMTGSINISNPNSMDFELKMVNLSISQISNRIMNNINFQEVISKRRRNYNFLLNKLKEIKGINICFENLPEGVCPYFLPVFVKDRANIQKKLLEQGISSFVVGEFLHPLLPIEGFNDARFISEHILGLPIHQDLEEKHLKYIVGSLKAVIIN